MTTIVTQWHEYSDEEKVAWLMQFVLQDTKPREPRAVYDLNLIAECEAKLTEEQRRLYIKYMSSDVALITYAGKTDEECQMQEVSDQFYWNFATAPLDLRGRIIWNVVADFAP